MTEFSHHSDYEQMQHEIQAMRQRIEDLEAHRRHPFMRWSWRWLPITAALLVAFSLLGAQNKPDALFIDSNGNVGINQTKPEKTLDVNGDALVRGSFQINGNASVQGQVTGKLDVTGNAVVRGQLQAMGAIPSGSTPLPGNSGVVIGNSDIYFANTPHAHTAQGNQLGFAAIENDSSKNYNALMILGRTRDSKCPPCDRVVELMDKLGIGKPNPQAPLDVAGEIRGKPWVSTEYVVDQGNTSGHWSRELQMTKADHSVCFLTGVKGNFQGEQEYVRIVQDGDRWKLKANSWQNSVAVWARCIGAPDDSW